MSSAAASAGADAGETEQSTKKTGHNKYRRDKPWDSEDIDHWKIEKWDPSEMKHPLLEESYFATLFPKYREKYLREIWPIVTRTLDKHGIACELNLVEGSMTVKTTRKTKDPYIILKARDLIKLLARSIPVQQAIKILDDEMFCDIIKIGGMVRNKERFVKRRGRLVGPDGATLKAIELLTNCYVLIQGNTVSAMGWFKGLKQVRKIVEDCMNNIHPIYHIKTLMIKRELEKDPQLKNENWERFLPKFKTKNVKRKKPQKKKEKKEKEYTPFPPENHIPKSKVDEQIESGEYFLSESQKQKKKKAEKEKKSESKAQKKQEEREAQFIPPSEKPAFGAAADDSRTSASDSKPRKRPAEDSASTSANVDTLKQKFGHKSEKKRGKKKQRLLDFD
eukprot:gb/GECG01001226.1/.p1 GENE.gb/GECG01001226.1/~~gb/GECG01001226.1/.p1  ORF type:complete len:392 (+),score=76.21 gb/GECG01001226.1/:1-1176(+)